jgi:hypothetical protein
LFFRPEKHIGQARPAVYSFRVKDFQHGITGDSPYRDYALKRPLRRTVARQSPRFPCLI